MRTWTAGSEHLPFVLSAEHVALYRVVTLEAQRFPELGRRCQSGVVGARISQLTRTPTAGRRRSAPTFTIPPALPGRSGRCCRATSWRPPCSAPLSRARRNPARTHTTPQGASWP
jgi:hypothetical protein